MKIPAFIDKFKMYAHVPLICGIGLAIYANSFHAPLHFDDFGYITSNVAIRDLVDPLTFWKKVEFPARIIGYYTFALNYHVHGYELFGYHVVNFSIHIINSFLVWWLSIQLLSLPRFERSAFYSRRYLLSLFVSLLFLTHPVQTQAVVYLSQRFASLATMFYVLSLCLYIKGRTGGKGAWVSFIFCGVFATAGMLTKQITLTLPVVIILTEFFLIRKSPRARGLAAFKRRYLVVILLFLLVIPAVYSFNVTGMLSMQVDSGSHRGDELDAWTYLLTQFRVVVTYVRLLVAPFNQNLLYDYPASRSLWEWSVMRSLLVLLALVGVAVKLFHRHRLISFGIIWFFVTLSVESSIILIRHVIFEHRLYLPSVGFFLSMVLGLYALIRNKRTFIAVIGLVVLVFSLLTFQRNKVWQSSEAMWKDVIKKSPEKSRPYMNLGIEYLSQGRVGQAIEEFTRALDKDPENERAYNNRGTAYVFAKQYEAAMRDFQKAMELDPASPEAYINRGNAYSQLGRIDLAIIDYNRAIERKSDSIEAHINRGNKYLKLGEYEKAISDFSRVIEIDGTYVKAYQARGNTYLKMGRLNAALADYDMAIQLDAGYVGAYYTRANVHALKGDYDKMLEDLGTVVELEPRHVNAYAKRGHILLRLKQFDKALKEYNMVLSLDPQNAVVLYTRSLAHQALGNYNGALADALSAKQQGQDVSDQYIRQLQQQSESF